MAKAVWGSGSGPEAVWAGAPTQAAGRATGAELGGGRRGASTRPVAFRLRAVTRGLYSGRRAAESGSETGRLDGDCPSGASRERPGELAGRDRVMAPWLGLGHQRAVALTTRRGGAASGLCFPRARPPMLGVVRSRYGVHARLPGSDT